MLTIRQDSWHYRYYAYIRGIWGMQAVNDTSICPYVQTMFWLTVLTGLFSPGLLLGWVFMKAYRATYKFFASVGADGIVGVLEKLPFGDLSEEVEKQPVPATLKSMFAGVVGIGFLVGVAVLFITSFAFLIRHITEIPGMVADFFIFIFSRAFIGLSGIGYGLHWTVDGIVSVANWLYAVRAVIVYWALFGLVCLVSLAVLVGIFVLLSKTALGQALLDKMSFRLNGFNEARERARMLAEERAGIIEAARLRAREEKRRKKMEQETKNGIGLLKTIWEFIKGIKANICPLVRFIPPPEKESAK